MMPGGPPQPQQHLHGDDKFSRSFPPDMGPGLSQLNDVTNSIKMRFSKNTCWKHDENDSASFIVSFPLKSNNNQQSCNIFRFRWHDEQPSDAPDELRPANGLPTSNDGRATSTPSRGSSSPTPRRVTPGFHGRVGWRYVHGYRGPDVAGLQQLQLLAGILWFGDVNPRCRTDI